MISAPKGPRHAARPALIRSAKPLFMLAAIFYRPTTRVRADGARIGGGELDNQALDQSEAEEGRMKRLHLSLTIGGGAAYG